MHKLNCVVVLTLPNSNAEPSTVRTRFALVVCAFLHVFILAASLLTASLSTLKISSVERGFGQACIEAKIEITID